MIQTSESEQQVVIWAPTGNDAGSISDLLTTAGIATVIVTSVADFARELTAGAGAAFIAREALDGPTMQGLSERLSAEPAWSKLPILLVTWHGAERGARLFSLADPFVSVANVVFLERPFTKELLLGSIRFALRSRLAQYALRDLTQRLDHSTEALKRSNNDLEMFASVAAHDLQEPLRTMGSYAELLNLRYADLLDDKGRQFCAQISGGAKRMSLLIASIKEYSLANRQTAGVQVISLGQPLTEALANLEQVIGESGATVSCETLPSVPGDATQLVVVFQNLISNAVKYTPGKALVRIAASESADEWRITIIDNGPGIAPGDQLRIFEIFTRLEAIGVSGSGIGLATCKRVIERHGGRIGVESAPGAGSTFWFTLPKAVGSAGAAADW